MAIDKSLQHVNIYQEKIPKNALGGDKLEYINKVRKQKICYQNKEKYDYKAFRITFSPRKTELVGAGEVSSPVRLIIFLSISMENLRNIFF